MSGLSIENRLRFYYFAYLASLGAFTPFFGLYIKDRGFSEWHVSVLMSVWYGTRIFAPTFWNTCIEKSPRPITWLRAGAWLCLLSSASFAPANSFVMLLIVMLLFSSIFNALMPQFETITLLHLKAAPERYSTIRVWGSLGFLLVVLCFGVIFKAIGVQYLIASMLPMVGLLIWASYLNDYPKTSSAAAFTAAEPPVTRSILAQPREWLRFDSPLRDQRFLALVCLLACNQIAHGPLYVYFGIYLQHYGFDESIVGYLWSLGVFAEIVAFFFMQRLFARVSPTLCILLSLLVGVVRWSLTATFPDQLWLLALLQIGHAFTFAMIHAACMQLLSTWLHSEQIGRAQGYLYGMASGFGGVVGALLAGWVWKTVNPNASFYLAAIFSGMGILFWLRIRRG